MISMRIGPEHDSRTWCQSSTVSKNMQIGEQMVRRSLMIRRRILELLSMFVTEHMSFSAGLAWGCGSISQQIREGRWMNLVLAWCRFAVFQRDVCAYYIFALCTNKGIHNISLYIISTHHKVKITDTLRPDPHQQPYMGYLVSSPWLWVTSI
jgi:hypothetical protein